jgi:ubiquilin
LFANLQQLFGAQGVGQVPVGGVGVGQVPVGGVGVQDPEERFRVQLQQLSDMGFSNKQLNIQVLTQTHGNVEAAVERLLNG